MLHLFIPPSPITPGNHYLFTVSIVLSFPKYHRVGTIQYVAFSDWLLSLSDTRLSFLPVLSWLDGSFLFTLFFESKDKLILLKNFFNEVQLIYNVY